MHYERWCSKLSATQIQLLQSGDINQWDPTLIFHVLLYSSWCLLAKKIQGTQFSIQMQSKLVKALAARIDLRNFLRSGDKIIVDLHSDPFRAEIRKVTQSQFFMQQTFNYPKGYQGQHQTQITVDVYICQKEWHDIEHLAYIRNASFAHCSEARITVKKLNNIVQDIEQIYLSLKVPQNTINGMKAIKSGKQTRYKYKHVIEFYNACHLLI